MSDIDNQKDQFSLEISAEVMERVLDMSVIHPVRAVQLKAQIQLLILDSIEFGIRLGGMSLGESE